MGGKWSCATWGDSDCRTPQNCMAAVEQSQVWVGSEDSVIYIINIHSMSCNKQLTDHRASVTGLVAQDGPQAPRYSGGVGGGRHRCGRVSAGARRGEWRGSGISQVTSLSASGLGSETHVPPVGTAPGFSSGPRAALSLVPWLSFGGAACPRQSGQVDGRSEGKGTG